MNKGKFLGIFFVVLMSVGAVVVTADVNGLGSGNLLGFVNGVFSGSVSAGSLTVTGSTSIGALDTNGENIDVGGGNISNAKQINGVYYVSTGAELYSVANSCTSGCEIHLESGTFTITQTIPVQSDMKIVGVGRDSVVTVGSSFDNDLFASNGRIHDYVLDNFEIDGNSGSQSSGNCIQIDGYYSLIRDMWVTDCKENGLYINSTIASSENKIFGGRFSGLESGINLASGNNDFMIVGSTVVGGVNTLKINGGGGQVSDTFIYGGSSCGINISSSSFLNDVRISAVKNGVCIDATQNNIIGSFNGLNIIGGSIFASIYNHSILVNTDASYDTYLNIYGTDLKSDLQEINLTGLGDVRIKAYLNNPISYVDSNNKIVSAQSVINSFNESKEFSQYTYNSDSSIDLTYNTASSNDAKLRISEAGTEKFLIWKDNYDADGIINTDDVVKFQTGSSTNMKFYSDGTTQFGDGSSQKGIILTSPDGTEYTCVVANGGTFSCS